MTELGFVTGFNQWQTSKNDAGGQASYVLAHGICSPGMLTIVTPFQNLQITNCEVYLEATWNN